MSQSLGMRIVILAVVVSGCVAPTQIAASGELAGETVVDCSRSVAVAAAARDDVTTLDVSTGAETLSLSWRGEVDRWYPLTVRGSLDGEACTATVDRLGAGAWEIDAECGSRVVAASVRGCSE